MVLPAIPNSFLDSAAGSNLELVLGTITGMKSDLLRIGTLAAEADFEGFFFKAATLGSDAEPAKFVFGPVLKLTF